MNERGERGTERKFDPARADLLDAPERDAYLPDAYESREARDEVNAKVMADPRIGPA